eukprot:3775127-Pyramimonas_sp.AAC.2
MVVPGLLGTPALSFAGSDERRDRALWRIELVLTMNACAFQNDLLDVIQWQRQILSIICGLIFGIIPMNGTTFLFG